MAIAPKVELDSSLLYLVESKEDETVRLALVPHFLDEHMRWMDTLRPRMKRGRLLKSTKTSATFQSEGGATYAFRPLTLLEYEQRVKETLEGEPTFSTEADMHRFFVERFSR